MRWIALLSVSSVLLIAGCEGERERSTGGTQSGDGGAQVDAAAVDAAGVDAAAGDAAGGAEDAAAPDAGGGVIPVAACPAATLSAFPLDVMGDSTTAVSEFEPSCAGAGSSPDLAIVWTAPAAGRYRFSTAGSAYDTVMVILNGSCGGTELDCQDDFGGDLHSESALMLTAGQSVTVVVDGLSSNERGAFRLQITLD